MLCSVVALSLIRGRFAPIGRYPLPAPISAASTLHLHGRIPGCCELIWEALLVLLPACA
jgi:hypothetical protein